MFTKVANFFRWPWTCRHEFVLVNKVSIYAPGKRIPVGKEYHFVCGKCAAFRRSIVQ